MDDPAANLSLQKQAIDAALNCKWQEAAQINQKLNLLDPENIPCLNRLAKALTELGQYTQAKKIYNEVLKLDPYNPIAAKNLKRISGLKDDAPHHDSSELPQKLSAALFLQEPGVTKIVNLIKVAEPQKLSSLTTGMTVNVVPKNRGIVINALDNSYLGVLPDDISHQLLKLIKGGNKYQAVIKSIKSNGLTVLIRETYRSRRFKNQPSFLDDSQISSFTDHISLPSEGLDESSSDSEEAES